MTWLRRAWLWLKPATPSVSIEWLGQSIGLVRYHPHGGSWEDGARYSFVCIAIALGSHKVQLKGGCGKFRPCTYRLIRDALKAEGFARAYWTRRNRPAPRLHVAA